MSVAARKKIDEKAYGKLLSRALPRAIRDRKELELMTAELLRLDEMEEEGRASPEEQEFAELLTVLVERYEDEHYSIPREGSPHENLAALMELRGIPQKKVAELIGSRSMASEILTGKREISKATAKKLAEFFRAPLELFL